MNENAEIEQEAAVVARAAGEIIVRDQSTRDAAMDYLRKVKTARKQVVDYFAPIKDAAHKAWKGIVAKEKELIDPLDNAERKAKGAIGGYDQEQDRIRLAEQRRLQSEADERARRERERLEKEASKLKTEAKREERLEQAAAVIAPTVTVAPAIHKQAGESVRKVWKARLVSIFALTGIEEGDVRLSCLEFNQTSANKFATATKGAVKVPGVEFYEERNMAFRI